MLEPNKQALLLSAERCYLKLKKALITCGMEDKVPEVDKMYLDAVSSKKLDSGADEIDPNKIF